MKNFKSLLSCMLCITIFFTSGMNTILKAKAMQVNLDEDIYEMDCMQSYIHILHKLNRKYNTDFAIPTEKIIEESNLDKEEIINFYTSFNTHSFEKYIKNAYQNMLKDTKGNNKEIFAHICAATQKQCIAFSDGNSIGFWATIYYADGLERYSSISNSCYDYVKTPYYVPSIFTYTLQNGNTQVYCKFKCYQYLTKNVMYTTTYKTFTGTFHAGGGDLYQQVSF